MAPEFVQLKQISMKNHPVLNEAWLHSRLSEQPELLGLGELDLITSEKTLPGGGRLDLLFVDSNAETRYEVEVQLGATDESHIIRTLEYWDIERRRYPQYEHVAVIVAEKITSRFFNVISLFNGFIPIVAIQAKALDLGHNQITLDFATVLDHTSLAREEDEADFPADRTYWEDKATPKTLELVDHLFSIVQEIDPGIALKYNKYYIGLARNGIAANYISFKPMKQLVRVRARRLGHSDIEDIEEQLDASPIDYDTFGPNSSYDYKFEIREMPDGQVSDLLRDLFLRIQRRWN